MSINGATKIPFFCGKYAIVSHLNSFWVERWGVGKACKFVIIDFFILK